MSVECSFCCYATLVDGPLAREIAPLLEAVNAARLEMGEPLLSAGELSTSLTVATGYLLGKHVAGLQQRAVAKGVPLSVVDDDQIFKLCLVHRYTLEHLSKMMRERLPPERVDD